MFKTKLVISLTQQGIVISLLNSLSHPLAYLEGLGLIKEDHKYTQKSQHRG